jgi:hypothetical protein
MLKGLMIPSSSSIPFSSISSSISSSRTGALSPTLGSSSSSIEPYSSCFSSTSSSSFKIYFTGLPLGSYLTTNGESLLPGTFD